MGKILVYKLPGTQSIVIKQVEGRDLFLSSDNVINISIPNLAMLIKFLVTSGMMNIKVLKGIISELEE